MNKDKTNIKKDIDIKSNIVNSLVNDSNGVNTKVGTAVSGFSKFNLTNVKDNKVLFGSIILVLLIVVGVIVYFFLVNKEDKNVNEITNKNIYETAYEKIGFKENNKYKKLLCVKQSTEDDKEVKHEETVIYYFDGNEVITSIYHIDIILSDEYMDYYDVMYEEYEKSLKTDYKYDNVMTNILKAENEILVTIIIDGKKESENKLGITPFVSLEEAKKVTIDSGYSCK